MLYGTPGNLPDSRTELDLDMKKTSARARRTCLGLILRPWCSAIGRAPSLFGSWKASRPQATDRRLGYHLSILSLNRCEYPSFHAPCFSLLTLILLIQHIEQQQQ